MIDLSKLFSGDVSGGFGDFKSGDALGLAAGGLGLAGGLIGAQGAQTAGKAAQLSAQGRVVGDYMQWLGYKQNAAEADRAAQYAGGGTALTREALGMQQRQADYLYNRVRGSQTASYAGAGVDPAAGSPLDVMGDAELQHKIDAINRFYTGDLQIRAQRNEAETDTRQAGYYQDLADKQWQAGTIDYRQIGLAGKAADTNSTADIIKGIGNAALLAAKVFVL